MVRPAAHVGADLSDQLQRSLRPDGMDLAQISAASERMQRSADVEGGRVLLGGLGAWRRRRGGGWRLLGGEQVEQRRDLGVAFGDLLEVEVVSREVLPQRERSLTNTPHAPSSRRGSASIQARRRLALAPARIPMFSAIL
jgi:hypothetical protein